jgi:DNA-binding SARP family transcriptional activator/Tfp pilus assembly protein PilF
VDGLEFRILGPLEVWRDGNIVPIEAAHQRAVLATLLLRANRVVSVEQLIELLWGDHPPASARPTLQTLVSRLRHRLVPQRSAQLLQTRAPGYVLSIEPARLDAHRFEELLRRGREALSGGDPVRATELLDQAVALWRGPALAGVSAEPLTRVERPRLAELYLQAVEDRAEARLRRGQDAELLGDLRALVAEQPLRERPYGQLMRALYLSGRQAEALETYQLLRTLLTEQLGIEPGPELQQLHLAVLRGEVVLDPPPPEPEPAPQPRHDVAPAQLPADVTAFTGRVEPVAWLDRMLATPPEPTGPVVVAIVGTAGVGKTALAVRWSHRVRGRFPDGQLYLDLNGYAEAPPIRPVEALGQFLRALGLPADQVPTDVQEAAGRYRTLLTGRRVLVVLDNARDAEQVRPLLPGSPSCLVLVTSRSRLDGLAAREGVQRLPLGVLSASESHELLTRTLGSDGFAVDPAAVTELARLCAHLPLALRIAAANLAGRGPSRIIEYTARLRTGNPLPALAVVEDDQTAVRAAFALSYAAVPTPAARLFRLLGLVPGTDFPVEAAAALAGTGIDETGRLLDRLAAAHLVQEHGGARFSCHDLLRRYAAELVEAEPGDQRAAAISRLFSWYLATTDAAAGLLYPDKLRLPLPDPRIDDPLGSAPVAGWDSPKAALAWLETEQHNLLLAAQYAAVHGPMPAAWLLADTLRGYLVMRMRLAEWQVLVEAGRAAAEAAADVRGQAAMQLGMGEAWLRQRKTQAAIEHYTMASRLSREADWADGEGSALASLGTAHQIAGRREEAADHYGRALELFHRIGRPHGQAMVLNNLGNTCWELGRLEEAADHYRQALEFYRALESSGGRALILNNLGDIMQELGRLTEAEDFLTKALALNRKLGNRASEAETLRTLAEVHCDAGRSATALEFAEAAVVLARESGDRAHEAAALTSLATVHRKAGHPHRAVTIHQAALQLARQVGGLFEAGALVELAITYRALGHHGPAESHASQALTSARARGYRAIEEQAVAALAGIKGPAAAIG